MQRAADRRQPMPFKDAKAMTTLDDVSSLTHSGSLLSAEGEITASYDLEMSNASISGYRPLCSCSNIWSANAAVGSICYENIKRVHIINGMGVTLGDSIVGLSALAALKRRYPSLSFTIYRPSRTPVFVKELYHLAAPSFGAVRDLPVFLDSLPASEPKIDIGNHLFWPNFSTMPMIDFFLWTLGLGPEDVPSQEKRNAWLRHLVLPELPNGWKRQPYVLITPTASTPVRSIPSRFLPKIVNRLWTEFRLPIVGFSPVEHDNYTNVSRYSVDTATFLAWVRGASLLVTSDTAALHVGAGFDVPTAAFFTTIPSRLRARDYPRCASIDLEIRSLTGIQASARPQDVELLDYAYSRLVDDDWIGALRARAA